MKRRALLKMFGVAPAVILTPGLLMPVRPVVAPQLYMFGESTAEGSWPLNDGGGYACVEPVGPIFTDAHGVTLNSIAHPVNRQLYMQRLASQMRRTKWVMKMRAKNYKS